MTNKEIKLELAKVALMKYNYANTDDLTLSVKYLYDWIMENEDMEVSNDENEVKQEEPYADKPISEILKWIDKQERYRSGGMSTRLTKIFNGNDINTIADLLKIESRFFRRYRDVGGMAIICINEALEELYGITSW